ncbi:ras-related protein Rab-20 isoform X3 [Hypanus sabinus]|uniref:ras-related protein Rab-20 isoform X3 n=1 Tax=Hypanus sabinus TaxID=79690 RepID=UPI0028C4DC68|nr:ras-related protein Rab-20 isoform X3 [Hypanus sabinus]
MMKPDGKVVILGDVNVGKSSLLQRYSERRFQDTSSTVGASFYFKHRGAHSISIWDTAGREQFHGLGSLYCRGAAAVILTYDVTSRQSLRELEDRFLALTESAQPGCIFAVAGNKTDLTDEPGAEGEGEAEPRPRAQKQVSRQDAISLYKQLLLYRMLEEGDLPAAETMCFETSAKTGHNVDLLFETVLDLVVASIVKKPKEPPETVDLGHSSKQKKPRTACCT